MILSIGIALTFQTLQLTTLEVKINHVRPSRLLTQIGVSGPWGKAQPTMGEIIPRSVIKGVSDVAGTITLYGPRNEIEDYEKRLRIFDVQPVMVVLSLKVDSAIDRRCYESKTTFTNNSTWWTEDSETGTRIGITPRVNDDGTVSIFVKAHTAAQSSNSMRRLKLHEPFLLCGTTDKWDGPDIRISVEDVVLPGK